MKVGQGSSFHAHTTIILHKLVSGLVNIYTSTGIFETAVLVKMVVVVVAGHEGYCFRVFNYSLIRIWM